MDGTSQVLKVGVTCTRFVSLPNARPWVIHAYRNIKGRGLHVDEDAENSAPTDKIDEDWKDPSQQKQTPYFYTEPVKEKAASGFGDDKVATSQDSKERSAQQFVDGKSPKKRKVDIEKTLEPKGNENTVPSDNINTNDNRTVSKRKLHVPQTTETTSEIKKRKIRDKSEPATPGEESSESKQRKNNVDKNTYTNSDNVNECLTDETENDMKKCTENKIGTTENNVDGCTNNQGKTENDLKQKDGNNANEEENKEKSEEMTTKRVRKRKLPEDAIPCKKDNDFAVSTYDKVRLIIQPWRKPEGGINKPILKMMLESIMLYLMMNPGSPEDVVVQRYSPYLQPMIIRNIVDVLEDIGCVSRQFIRKSKPSLFSKPTLPYIGLEEEEDSTALIVPAEDCVIKLGLFGQEIFPNSKWPENTYLPHER